MLLPYDGEVGGGTALDGMVPLRDREEAVVPDRVRLLDEYESVEFCRCCCIRRAVETILLVMVRDVI